MTPPWWRSRRVASGIGGVLFAVGVLVASVGRREVFDLWPEEDVRSVRRFVSGAPEIEVNPRLSWARVPALLPGPGDRWAGNTAHTITFRLGPQPSRGLALYVVTETMRSPGPAVAPVPGVPERDAETRPPASVRVTVNGATLGTLPSRGRGDSPIQRTRERRTLAIPAGALGDGPEVRLSLVNDAGPGVAVKRVRLTETVLRLALSQLTRKGRFPSVSAAVLAASLSLLLWGRIGAAARGSGRFMPALGPALSLLLVGLAVVWRLPAVPRWGWLLLIMGPLLLVRPRPRPSQPEEVTVAISRRAPATPVVRRVGSLLINGVIAMAGLIVSLVAAEAALRMVFRTEPWVPPLSGTAPFRRHLAGMLTLDAPAPPERSPHVYRIALVGDSLSVSVPVPRRFGSLVAERLNAGSPPGRSYEVVSFAEPGADTEREIEILRRIAWRARPDFVLLQWYANDAENGDYGGRPRPYALIPGDGDLWERLRQSARRSVFYLMLQNQFEWLQDTLELVETYPAYMYERFGNPDGAPWQHAADRLREFIAECTQRSSPVALVLFPHFSAGLVTGAYEYDFLHDAVLEICRETAIPCVDLRSTFAPYRDYTSLWVHRFDPHPNELAHRVAAERIVEALGPLWLHPPRAHAPAEPTMSGRDAGRTARSPAPTRAGP